jgi:amino acid adenylation domain-containing protein
VASPGFDASVWETWAPLTAGAEVHVPPRDVVPSPSALLRWMAARGITVTFLPTPLAEAVLSEPLPPGLCLRALLTGGDRLRRRPAEDLPFVLVNHYGPTEYTVVATAGQVAPIGERAPDLGAPIANTRVYVLDRSLRAVPLGVAGELCLAGVGLARGYRGRPELTAERFVPDPFGDGGRLYRTGDLARRQATGEIEFLGRIDHQVKIRGHRIELGEIEAALGQLSAVREAVVVVREPEHRLVACVVPAPGEELSGERLRAALAGSLPAVMIPAAWVFLDALPLTPNGKVDRKALARLAPASSSPAGPAPRTPVEATVAAIWADLLGVPPVGVADDLFALGGHSLLAVRLVGRVRERLGVDMPLRTVFEAPTVAAMAGWIEAELRRSRPDREPPLVPGLAGPGAPLSFAQQRLWFLDRLEPGSATYNIPILLRFGGPLRPGLLAAALAEVIRRHAALRTTFELPEGAADPVQAVHPPPGPDLPVVDLDGLAGRGSEAARLAAAEARRPFDLRRGPLLRAVLIRLGPDENRLLVNFHHIVADGGSVEVLQRELGALYPAFAAGRPSPLPELPVQYPDFAVWQRRWLAGEELERQLAYWRERLASPPVFDLPADRPRPAVWSYRGAALEAELPEALAAGVERLGRSLQATPFMTLLAGFLTLLHRYTGQDDLLVGTPVAGRGRTEVEGLIGFFVNTLPLRAGLAGEPSFAELVARVRESALVAYAHQDLPFERLVAEVLPERDLSRNPLFQVLFAFLDGWQPVPVVPGLAMAEAEGIHSGTAKFDLSFHVNRTEGRLRLWLEYATDLFDGATVRRLTGHFERLLAGAVERPEMAITALPLLSEVERAQLAALDEAGHRGHPVGLLHGLFEAQARRTPDAVALVAGETVLTYAELEARSARLAARLRALGAGPETGVAVCLERRADLVVTLLAVLRSGSFYVPVDPRYPEERRAFLVEDSGARILVDEAGPHPPAPSPAPPPPSPGEGETCVQPSNLAYLIYTSGSTGRPKAVAISHASAVKLAYWAREVFSPDELRGVLACTAVTFDLSVFEIFVTLAWGGAVVLVDDALALLSGPPGHEITLVNTVPSAMAELLRADALPASVRTVNLAGEALTRALSDRVYARPETARLYNLYGPSEDTTYSTWTLVEARSERQPSIGRPVHDTRGYVVDRWLGRLPVGVPGELCLAGGGLARGYLGRPELTAERFVPDPFSVHPGERMYRTGDLAKLRVDGELDYLGRLDHQVKIRGYRIEPGEVESVLMQLPGVRAAAVLVRENVLVGYLAAEEIPVAELRQALLRTLPEPMVPSSFVFLAELPLTPHGKVDRRALALLAPASERRGASGPPRTPMEAAVAGIWSDLLGVEGIGAADDFFTLGGHSLLAARVAALVLDRLGVELPLRAIFQEPTVARLAAWIEAGSAVSGPALLAGMGGEAAPLSFAQQRLWFFEQLQPGSPAYNIPLSLIVSGPSRPEILAAALAEVVRRHAALRTTFEVPEGAGDPVQVVHPVAGIALPAVDLAALPPVPREAEAGRLAAGEARRPFDLRRLPLLRSTLLRLGESEGSEHRLLVTMHHIVSDGVSIELLLHELGTLCGSPSSPLPELPVQYPDFAVWQRSWLTGGELERQLAWWRGRLARPPVVELPADRPRPAVWSYRGGLESATLPAGLADRLERLGRHHGATPFMTLLTAFLALLHRYTGQTDLIVGTPVAGRVRPEIQELIGFFVNTLALRVSVDGGAPFPALLSRVRETALAAYGHQDVPFEALVAELAPGRDLSRNPLVQVVFALENSLEPVRAGSGVTLAQGEWVHNGTAKFDLSLHASRSAAGLVLWAEYASDLFDRATVLRLLGWLGNLLAGVCEAGEGTAVQDLPLLGEGERAQLVREWSGTATDWPRAATVHGLFEEQARRFPERVALLGEEELTYAALDQRAERLAARLRGLGVGPDDRVGLCAERSTGLIAAILGILKAGGAYLPLDPELPAERLAGMVADAEVRVLVVQEELAASLPDLPAVRLPLLGALLQELPPGSSGPRTAVDPDNLACVMFTSGSTGRPKGVAVTHGNVVRLVRDTNYARLDAGGVFLQLAPVAFDASTFEIWGPLLNGGRLALFPPGPPDLRRLGEAIKSHGVTTLWLTAGLFHQMVESHLEHLRPVRQLLAGGDVLSPSHVRRAVAGLPGMEIINGYGPTEATTFATFHPVHAGDPEGPVPIGRALANARVYVLDAAPGLAPMGAVGQLYVGGDGLARGYLGRPDLTAERFVPDAVSGEPGARLYATGDLARWRPAGVLDLLGRVDQQVKLRGFRIEPGEIESVLASHPEVESAVVVAREDVPGDKRLVAYVVPAPGSAPEIAGLPAFLELRLPAYMVPAAFVFLPELPLTANGKVDRRALPTPGLAAGSAELVPPGTLLERDVAEVWKQVLGVERVGLRDSFWELGGHSLLATRILARIEAAFGVEMPLQLLFTAPTLGGFAALLAEKTPSAPSPILRRAPSGPAPLSFAQERLWLLDRLEPGGTAYNIPMWHRLRGPLDAAALELAVDGIVHRHEALRTTFSDRDGEAVQVIAPPAGFRLPIVDLSALREEARRNEARLAAAARPFDLERGPLFRVALVRLAAEEHVLVLDMHHIVSDGWSFGVFFRELADLYGALREGGEASLPELPVQYSDFAVWQRERLRGGVLEEQLSYWRGRLDGAAPVLELPLDRVRPAVQSHRGRSAGRDLPPALVARLRELSLAEGVTPFITLLAVFQLLLSRLAGQDDVVVGSPSAGRGRAEVEGLIGLFLNTLVLRTDLRGDPAFRELLGRVRETVLGAYRYQETPFERLLEELQPERQLSRTPLFQVLFNFVSIAGLRLTLPGLEAEPVELEETDSKFDFTLYVNELPDSLRLDLVYNPDLFELERMAEMLRQLETLLEQAVAAPAPVSRAGSWSLVTPAALLPDPAQPLSGEWRGSIQDALSRGAAAHPDRLAVQDAQGAAWSYAELEDRANRLARFLVSHGVETGDAVAIWAHRGAPLVQALMGTLKAGAAFMVLDPAYPAARLLDYLRIARPAAWIAVPGAPPPPAEVAEAAACCRCRVDLGSAALTGMPATDPGVPVGPDDAACITFTSGSTGVPKGVVGRHGPLTHFYPWMGERFGLGAEDRFGMLSALSHDPLQRDVFTPVWFGARMVLPDPGRIGAPGYLAGWLKEEGVTVLHLTPALMEMVLGSADDGNEPVRALPELRRAFVVGDLLKKLDVERLQRLAPAVGCVNLYGSTETQRSVSFFPVPRGRDLERLGKEVLPLGHGMGGMGGMEACQLLVLNRAGGLAGVGELGEIHVRSRHLARGYLGDEALTAARFLSNPLAASPGEGDRVYRTGDLGRYLVGGGVELAGRADFQVKLRGFRIELGEVEAALSRHPEVRECVVIVREDRPGERRLVGYLTSDSAPSPRELRAFLASRLPDYMVPSAFVVLPELPLTRTGKVDRRALPAPAEERPGLTAPAERSPVQELLAGIWADLLGVPDVAPHESFFDLGGHSLLATRMISRVRSVLGLELPMRAVFEEPTLASFAAAVERARSRDAEGETVPPLVRVPRGGLLPTSFAQQRLWFLDRLEPGSFAYNLAGAVRLEGSLDVASLAGALGGTAGRHEPLRTRFVEEDGEPWQVIAEPSPIQLPVLDLSGLPVPVRRKEEHRLAVAESRRPFDLALGPLARFAVLRLGEREHVLLVCLHHIVSDGWSMGIFVRELGVLYRRPMSLPELPIQYADYASWQRRWLSGQALEERLAWWKRQLAGAPQVVELPLDRPRPAVQSYRGGRVYRTIGAALAARRFRLMGVTPFMTLLAGFTALLSRYGGQADVVVGTPTANRGRAELEDLIGFFANTLALRVDLSGDPGFDELARRVREMSLEAYAHQDIPFERLVEELRPERDLSHAPVFQVMLALQNLPASELDLAGLALSPMELDFGRTQYDLSLFLFPQDGGLSARLEYASDLFDATTAERILGHFQVLLEGAAAGPEAPLSRLPLLTGLERAQLAAWDQDGHRGRPGHPDGLLHALFEAQARRTPGAVALVAGGTVLTYAELEERSARLAARLKGLGAGPEVGVAVCLERTAGLVVSLLSVLRSGSFYVPIDPRYPEERRRFLVEDSGARIVVDEAGIGPHPPAPSPGPPESPSPGEGETYVAPANLAYLIYTSGSTGRPKAVGITHASAVKLAYWARGAFSPAELRGVLASTAVTFDLSVFEIFVTLSWGGAVVLVEDALALLSGPPRQEITLVNTVPSAMAALLREDALPPSVRTINLAGEALPRWLADRAYARPETERVCNLYGPSEDTTYSTWTVVERASERAPSIGRPVDDTRAYVLDPGLERLPVGVPGELYLAGSGLARGYLGRPELTAERFVPDPFSGEGGARMYRTGDLVRLLADGGLDYLGRLDHQVKIRGFRIELGEVEAALSRQPGVESAVVLAREERLVAYLVGGGLSAPELRRALQRELPEAMVPSAFVFLEAFPLTAHGKVDRRALPAPEVERREGGRIGERSPVEELLAGIWADLLGVPGVGSRDGFFELGGHSLLATRMVSRVRAVLGVEISLRAVFEEPSLAGFADLVERARKADAVPEMPPLVRVPRGGPLPASFAQQRLWFLNRLDPESFAYNLAGAMRLEGSLDVPALAGALGAVVRRHESLRTVFVDEAGEPWQWISEPAPVPLPLVDLAGLPEATREQELHRIALGETRRPYDLARGPLLRSTLLRLSERAHALLVGMHHVVSDGWSLGIFVRELGELYGKPAGLPELPIQYADYAAWQRQWLGGEVMEERVAWWTRRLAGAPPVVDLPLDRPRPSVQGYRGGRVDLAIEPELTERFDSMARRLGATPFMALLAAFATLLSRYGNQDDVVVGTPVANRGRAELEDLIGLFANTLALRVDLSGDPGFGELARRVREMSLGAYARQDVPFERLVDELRPERSLSHSPVFQVVLALQNLPDSELDLAGLTLSPLEIDAGRTQFDLSLFLHPMPDGGLSARLNAASDLFDTATAHRLLGHFRRLLEGIVEDENGPVSELPLLDGTEREQVLTGWNRTEAEIPEEPVHRLFFQWAERAPDAPAVVWEGGSLTYGELAARALDLADRLRAGGVGPEAVVALCLERSAELITAALAVLETGAAYLPMDPAWPEERQKKIVQDSGAVLLLGMGGGALSRAAGEGRGGGLPEDGLAYVIYTSGSTGTPKGSELCHRGLSSLMAWHRRTFGLGPGDRTTLAANPGFDASVWDTWAPLTAGAAIHIPPREVVLSPPAFLAWAAERGITSAYLPTPLAEAVMFEPLPAGLRLRTLFTGGDRLRRRPPESLPFSLVNVYGPTECTVMVTAGRIAPGERAPDIGAAVANSRVYVLDRWLRPVPVGVPGEICLAGAGLGRGYRQRPELTARTFVPNPFGDGERLYRTGDLARRLPSGELEFLGRFDHQVKIRGNRIELGEVETVLARQPGVESAVVLAREDTAGDKRLVAYAAGDGLSALDLRKGLQRELPDFMVPSAFVFLDALPLTANGKVDRRALPAPEAERREGGRIGERSAVEELLAGIWADLLGVSGVGSEESFFDLGGHSLLATRMVSRVRAVLGVEIPLRAVFEEPALAGFAALIERARQARLDTAGPAISVPLVRVPRSGPLPASFSQQRLWFLSRLDPESSAYNLMLAVRLGGALDVAALAGALDGIARRHEALRTVFVEQGGEPWQVISEPAPLGLPIVDLAGLPDAVRDGEARRAAVAEDRRRYDLARGPLLRTALLRLGSLEHALLLGMHHIVSDGWSLGIFLRELGELYRRPGSLPELPIQYADYAAWQRQWLSGEVMDERLAWWKHQLAGAPPLVDLPLDRPRPGVQSFRGDRVSLTMGSEPAARRLGVTPFMALLAGFATLLSRYGGQSDVVVGTPIANRGRAELEGLIGMFVNTLALRVDLSGDPGFDELARRVREAALGAFARQDVPFERLVDELRPERSLSHSPVFQVMLALQNLPVSDLELEGLTLSPMELDSGRTQYDLSLFVYPLPDGGLLARMGYASDLFDAATARRILGHFQVLLAGVASAPETPLSRLPLLTGPEQAQLAAWDQDGHPGHPDGLLHALFEAQARRTPEAVALVASGTVLSYAELEERSARLAASLKALGAGPEVGVAVCLERTAELVATLLAVLRSGSFYVPVDPRYPEERRSFLVEDSGARIVIDAAGIGPHPPAPSPGPPESPAPGEGETYVAPANLAYLIYTSGSTGRPKAVGITHGSAVVLAHWARGAFSAEELRGVLASTAVTFDLSVFEIFVTLSWGGAVVLVEDALALLSGPPKHEITLVNTVPSAMAELLREDALPPSVRTINLAGEALPRWLADRAYARPETERVCNLYGPSEDTTYSTWTVVERAAERAPSIGRPADDTRAYVLDPGLERRPVGVPGELYLAGSGLARGYLGRPELTAERFVPDPFSEDGGARMYRTGDLVRLRPDGELDYLGRLDHQVKIRGFRIELGEVEAALSRQPGVESAVVLAREGAALVAYVTGAGLSASDLRQALQRELPEAMVPSAFVFLEAFPLTAHGKVDRRALPALEIGRREGGRPGERSPAEELLAGIWADLLGVSGVGSGESFFELGGHSLLATRMISRVRALFGVEIPLRAVFEAPTLAGFAALIEQARRSDSLSGMPPLVRVPRNGPLPASFAQQRLWFLDRLGSGSSAYNLAGAVRLAGSLDASALAGALSTIVRRHEALRTVFVEEAGQPWQVISEPVPLPLPLADLAGLPEARAEEELRRIAVEEARRPYSLARGPLVRSTLLRLRERAHALLVGMHHIVSDGWSLGIFVRELGELYGNPAGLPELPIQYADYAVWQRQWLSGEVMEERVAWWKDRLTGAPPVVDLPLDRPRPSVQGNRGNRVGLAIEPGLAERFDSLARRLGVTPFMALLAAFATLLSRYGGQDDVVVGTPIANRGRAELEDLIGFFVNTLALRVDLSGDPGFGELAGRVREMSLGAYAHQDIPFERLVDELRPERSLSHSPVFQVALALQNLPVSELDLAGLTLSPLDIDAGRTQFDLSLFLHPMPDGGLSARLYAASDLFDVATARRLLGHFHRLLEGIVDGDNVPVSELPLLDAAEREQALTAWNRTEGEIPEEPVHRLFFQWAERTPEAVAVAWEGGSLTYGELAGRALDLADRLRADGVGPETVVALRLDRSAELLAAALAVLEAGGAYLPIDPSWPEERQRWIAEDSGAVLLNGMGGGALSREAGEGRGGGFPASLAYVIYTSGSTGRPKGTELCHRGLSSLIAWHRRAYGLGPGDRTTLLASPGFDASVWETWAPLTAGAAVYIPPREVVLSPSALLRWMAEQEITVAFLPTPLAEAVLSETLPAGLRLRALLTGGDRLRRRPAEDLPFALVNHYGPTESTVVATAGRVAPTGDRLPDIGAPIANTRVYILDRWLQPVPVGAPGELCLAGEGLARCYRGRSELTARSFAPDPVGHGERLYRTGDLARRLASGEIEFLGRIDHQVKIRGHRIELGEVEAALAALPEVESCVAVARPDALGENRLVAYVVPKAGGELDPAGLRSLLESRLPAAMIPSVFAILPELPLDPNGKIDRRALPEPVAPFRMGSTPPRTPLEEEVARIWCEVLGIERVGVEDSFWDLGGHSLLATRVLARLTDSFGVEIPLQTLFLAPALGGFSAAVGEAVLAGLSDAEMCSLLDEEH